MSTIVSITDHNTFFNLLTLYFYDEVLDVDLLQKSLEETIKRVPVVASKFVCGEPKEFEDERLNYLFEHFDPSKVKILKKVMNDEDFSKLYQPDESSKVLNVKEGMKFYEIAENVTVSPSYFHPKVFGFESFKACLIETANSTKSILAVSFNHAVVDGFSLACFMDLWSSIHNHSLDTAKFQSFTLKRPNVLIPNFK